MAEAEALIAGVETGGTKVVCAVARASSPGEILRSARFPTTSPRETLGRIGDFLAEAGANGRIAALGIASFGPVNVEPDRPRYGWITGTPKPGWADTDLLAALPTAAEVPTAVLSDVSAAALGEHRRLPRGVRSSAYATFGTGVGVGIVLDGRVHHGDGYPEVGHLLVRRHPQDDFAGSCPFHGDCVEGLAAGPAVLGRWGADASSLPAALRATALEILGWYIAQVGAAVAGATGVERMVVGGGVAKASGLLDAARQQLPRVTGGPAAGHAVALDAPDFLVPPALGDASGVLGAVAAAADLLGGTSDSGG